MLVYKSYRMHYISLFAHQSIEFSTLEPKLSKLCARQIYINFWQNKNISCDQISPVQWDMCNLVAMIEGRFKQYHNVWYTNWTKIESNESCHAQFRNVWVCFCAKFVDKRNFKLNPSITLVEWTHKHKIKWLPTERKKNKGWPRRLSVISIPTNGQCT